MKTDASHPLRALLGAALLALAACTSEAPAGGQCAFNTDCAEGLTCVSRYCRALCGDGGTCGAGLRCEPAAGTGYSICVPAAAEQGCAYASDCPAPLVCSRDGRCRPQCVTDYDCKVINPYLTCVEGSCSLVCARGTADCDGASRNGCEASLASPQSCGACGRVCASPTSVCAAGADGYACVSRCGPEAPTECGGSCVNLQTDPAHCGACGMACAFANGSGRCAAGRCELTACNRGFADCDGNPANGCEADLASDAHCGACGNACAGRTDSTGVPHTCQAGACAPRNDTCAGAQTIDLGAGPSVSLLASNRHARHDLDAPCDERPGADVWFRFTLTRREIVYADTFGARWDTELFFASDCATPLTAPTMPDDVLCNDNAPPQCEGDAPASRVVALLEPGTYYLVVAGIRAAVGETPVRFQHLPVGSGPVQTYPAGMFKGMGSFEGRLTGAGALRGTCGGDGPEASFWWTSCSIDQGGILYADTCEQPGNLDTVLYLRHGDGSAEQCNDNAPNACSLPTASHLEVRVPAGPGLHVLTLDGNGPGSYFLMTQYPYFRPS